MSTVLMMSKHSNKAEKEEFIEILDHGYVVRKGSTEVHHCIRSRKAGQCFRSECRRKHTRNSLHMRRIRRLRKKMREKKKEEKTKEKSPEIEIISVQKPSHLLPQQESSHHQSFYSPLTDSSTIIDLLIEGEPAPLPEPISSADTLPMSTEFEVPSSINEAVESSDASHLESDQPELENDTVDCLDEADTENGDMIDVVRKLLWHINSAYHYRGVLSEEDIGDSPNVRLEPEPTNLSDPNAIKLMFQAKNGEWVHGGYVPKVETQKVRDLGGSIIGARVAFWRNRGSWRAPYVQLLYRDRVKRVAVTNQTLLTPSIVTERYWVGVQSRKHKIHPRRVYGKWLLFVDKKQLDSVWHRIAYNVQNGYFGKGCTTAKCSTAMESQYCSDSSEGVICVYTTRSAANHVGFKLSKLTRIPKIRYKTDAATLAGIYAGDPGCTIKTINYNNGIPRLSKTKQT